MVRISKEIIFEDEDIVVINKPSGLLTIPDREGKETSLKNLLQENYGQIFTVHRLDKDTSGLILFAKNEQAHRHLSLQFENRETEKIYYGLVMGSPVNRQGTIDAPIAENSVRPGIMLVHQRGKSSLTDYEVIDDFGSHAWIRFRIHTGRTHQVRVHSKHIGHAIVCDEAYGDGKPLFLSSIKFRYKLSQKEEEERPLLNRLALHASRIKFKNMAGEWKEFEAPLPKDLRAAIQQLEKHRKK